MADSKNKPNIRSIIGIEAINQSDGDYEPVGRLAITEQGKPIFVPSSGASDEAIRRTFLQAAPLTGKPVPMDPSLPGLMGGFPLPGTPMHNKIAAIIGSSFDSRSAVKQFEAMVGHQGTLEKNGLRLTDMSDLTPRSANIARHISAADNDHLTANRDSIAPALLRIHEAVSVNAEVAPGGILADNRDYANLMVGKSEGNQNIVLDDQTGKKVKIILGPDSVERTEMEALANKVIQGAGYSAPDTEIVRDEETGKAYLSMDNYKLSNGVTEDRQEYFMDLLKKPMGEVHQMTYNEMASFLDIYERELPENLRSAEQVEDNKKAIFQWAMVNSATNNTDNHGRNLAVLVNDQAQIRVTPFIDVNFDKEEKNMSTWLGGIPPIHKIDITDNAQVEKVWMDLGIKGDVAEAFTLRDDLAASMASIPEYAKELGISLYSDAMEHVVASVQVQSPVMAKAVEANVDAARAEVERQYAAERKSAVSLSM